MCAACIKAKIKGRKRTGLKTLFEVLLEALVLCF